MSRRRRQIIVIALALVAAATVTRAVRPGGGTFNAAGWSDETRVMEGGRLAMAEDVVTRRLLSVKTRAEVIAMLGEPPKTTYFADWDLVYWLGPERGFVRIDSEWLVVRFDANERVSAYRIVRD